MKSRLIWKLFFSFSLVVFIGLLVVYVWESLVVSALVALVIASLFGLAISHSMTRSIKEILIVVQKLTRGDFSARLFTLRKDELGSLGATINIMAQSLETQISEIQRDRGQLKAIVDGITDGLLVTDNKTNVLLTNPALDSMLGISKRGVGLSVLEWIRNDFIFENINNVLRHGGIHKSEFSVSIDGEVKNIIIHSAPFSEGSVIKGSVSVLSNITEIRKLEGIRREFVANISHELKTPLTSIRGYSETLRFGAIKDVEAAASFLEKIESNAIRLQRLVEGMLQLSRIEAGKVVLQKSPVFVKKIVDEISEGFEQQMRQEDISLENLVDGDRVVLADAEVFRQILSNLIENAVRYNRKGGRITVGAKNEVGFFCMTVKDTGVGIHSGDIPHIFERFYRGSESRATQTGGTGLGLAIVKHLVHAHGGDVFVESELNQGSKFLFTIPTVDVW